MGALLIAGLLFFSKEKTENNSTQGLKPSQLDFSKSNRILAAPPEPAASAIPKPEKKMEAPSGLSAEDLRAWATLEDILKTNNDNDPRMDQELKQMSPEIHEALFQKYESLQMENRNGRGMIAFLVARDLKSPADAEFLRKIYQESPCAGLEDCKNVGSDDAHHSGINQTTLNYPQFSGLYEIEARLNEHPEILKNPSIKDGIVGMLKQAAEFPVPVVQKKAEEIRARFGL